MRLVGLVEHPEHVCCRYRLAAFQPFLERVGHHLELQTFPRSWWSWIQLKRSIGHADAVVLQRRLLPAWQLRLLRGAARRLLFDFDDAVFLRDSYAAKGMYSPRRLRRFADTIRHVDAVVAGNDFLGKQAAHWIDPRRIQVIPTCVDVERYPTAAHQRAGTGAELVWIGSSSTLKGLETIRPLLEDVGRCWPGLHMKLIGDRFLELENLSVIRRPWSEATEADDLATADIGISWVPDDPWSRGKCGLKVLQYMAAGLPVVANPVGVQSEMVRHGETGFLATTADEWSVAVGRLAHNPLLRTRMGQAGRARVEREFSVTVGAARWVEMLGARQRTSALAG
jgi:glycosyltransferase involved in cell wall biosynthesis